MTSPIQMATFPDPQRLNPVLLEAIRAAKLESPRSFLGVGGSWASPKTLHEDPRLLELLEFIRAALVGFVGYVDCWAVELRPGDEIKPHDHVRSHRGGSNTWAGVYYVSVAFSETSELRFQKGIKGFDTRLIMPGVLYTWPADLQHWTTPSSAPRTAIAFSAKEWASAHDEPPLEKGELVGA